MTDPKFPYPLDVDIEEQVPVKRTSFDPGSGKIKTIIGLETQKVRYIDAPKEKIRCKNGEHVFYSSHPKKWIVSCRNCRYSHRVMPGAFRLEEDGSLINLRTNKRI